MNTRILMLCPVRAMSLLESRNVICLSDLLALQPLLATAHSRLSIDMHLFPSNLAKMCESRTVDKKTARCLDNNIISSELSLNYI